MIRNVKLAALQSDLSAINTLLNSRTEESDPIGWFQLSKKRDHVAGLIRELRSKGDTRASVALYFGGRPVVGSAGIHATFAGQALKIYQQLIAKRLARKERGGDLAERGRIPKKDEAELLITEVARGSFGFILEEPDSGLVDSALKDAVADVNNLIYSVGVKAFEDMDNEPDILDKRLLLSARKFFRLLDDAGATMRIATDKRQISLSREQVEAGRKQIDGMEWSEDSKEIEGTLFIIPDSQRFDLEPADGTATIRGRISKPCIDMLRAGEDSLLEQVLGRRVAASVIEKTVRSNRGETKLSYTLTKVRVLRSAHGGDDTA